MFGLWRAWRRRRLRQQPLPPAWVPYLERQVPFYRTLPDPLRERFHEQLKIFVAEKHFAGARGMEITDEVKVVIAAAAVRLTLHLGIRYYDRLTEIVVYPFDYRHPDETGGVQGEAHTFGTVVLSWPSVLRGLADPRDGHDTATHEFAHVLDVGTGGFDGAPQLRSRKDYQAWSEVMSRHYERLIQFEPPERDVLRSYAATDPAEFFAVATEVFFERPDRMKEQTPAMYEELRRFYGFDPASELEAELPDDELEA